MSAAARPFLSRRVRWQVAVRAGYRCERCAAPAPKDHPIWHGLHVHHVNGQLGGENDAPENLRLLCARCHKREESLRRPASTRLYASLTGQGLLWLNGAAHDIIGDSEAIDAAFEPETSTIILRAGVAARLHRNPLCRGSLASLKAFCRSHGIALPSYPRVTAEGDALQLRPVEAIP